MKIMGVVNVTPDSFSDGGLYANAHTAIDRALTLADQGADIIDVGGESSRSGAVAVSASTEQQRVLPVIRGIRRRNANIPISIDTYKASTALAALEAGATMVNDISAGILDAQMFSLIRDHHVPYIMMHMQGTPTTMQQNPFYTDVVAEVMDFLGERLRLLGNTKAMVYVDPGIGFGKALEHNLELLRNLERIASVAPMVLGISRKRFITELFSPNDIEERDKLTALIHGMLPLGAINITRVHSVGDLVLLRTVWEKLGRTS